MYRHIVLTRPKLLIPHLPACTAFAICVWNRRAGRAPRTSCPF